MKPTLVMLALATTSSLAAAAVTEKIDETHTLAANGTVRLSNVNGPVEITAWDRNEVHLVAVKTADNPEDLAAIEVQINATPDRLTISTEMNDRKRRNTAVHYTLRVPAGATIDRLSTVNSDVTIEGVQGRIAATTVNGHVVVNGLIANASLESTNGNITAAVGPLNGQSINCRTINGICTLLVPSVLNATVQATAGNGRVNSEVPLRVRRSTRNFLRGDFGEGGGFIELSTINGDIRLRRQA